MDEDPMPICLFSRWFGSATEVLCDADVAPITCCTDPSPITWRHTRLTKRLVFGTMTRAMARFESRKTGSNQNTWWASRKRLSGLNLGRKTANRCTYGRLSMPSILYGLIRWRVTVINIEFIVSSRVPQEGLVNICTSFGLHLGRTNQSSKEFRLQAHHGLSCWRCYKHT